MESETRKELIAACRDYLEAKVLVVRTAMDGLKDDLENESKSSAGDKFETGREMINIEWNKLSIQLNEYDRLGQILNRIKDHKPTGNIVLGSIVITKTARYFISIPAGEIRLDTEKFYAVGVQAPIARIMIGKSAGAMVNFNEQEFEILEVI